MTTHRWHPLAQLVLARVREFYREPAALFWVYGFPLILAILLGAAFSRNQPKPPTVDVQAEPDPAWAAELAAQLRADGLTVEVHPAEDCRRRLRKTQTALYLAFPHKPGEGPGPAEYVFDPTRDESVTARYWVEALRSRHEHAVAFTETLVSQRGSRYIDFLLPGLVGMNIMGGGLFGVGFVLVDMRSRKLFKRVMATPVRHSDFLLAILVSRLLFLVPEMLSLLVVARLLFDVPINGSVLALVTTILCGAAAFAGLGLLFGSRTEKTETISGLVNLVMLPQYLLSGIFFSASRFPDAVQPLIQALPLTQLIDALRTVMLEEGAGFAEIGWRLAILAGYAVVTFALALRWFKWR